MVIADAYDRACGVHGFFAGMRVAMASSFMSIIPAEILAADSGIGYRFSG